MLQSLIITLREGVEAALVIGIATAYLKKSGRESLVRMVYLGLAAAVAASIAGAVVLSRIHWNEDAFEGVMLLVAAVFVATLVLWMRRAARGLKQHIEQRLESMTSQSDASAPGVFFFVFLMVFREGIETVLLLAAVSMKTSDLLNFFGVLTGLALAVVFGIIFVRGTVRLDLRRFFHITTVILLCVAAQLVVTGLHELSESRILPSSRLEMAWIGPMVSNDIFFFVVILALAMLMVLFDWRSRQRSIQNSAAPSSSERRKQLWNVRREKLWMAAVCSSAFVFIVLVTAEFIYARNETSLSPAEAVQVQAGMVRIPLESLSDGSLHRFVYNAGDVGVRFMAFRVGDHFATALDACRICGTQGYYQKGNSIICRNCGSAIFGPSIGSSGGCNPVPLPSTVAGSELTIRVSDLASGAGMFSSRE